jgi:anaerobic selenocysteine-containing dehydrogenase
VTTSQGTVEPVSTDLRSEPAIVAALASAVLGPTDPVDWAWLVDDYDRIRDLVEAAVVGFDDYNTRVRRDEGLELPNPARQGDFSGLPGGRARLTVAEVPTTDLPDDVLVMMTIRSHDQFNTTIYGHDDRYRGIRGDRRVVLLHPDELAARGLCEGQRVDVTSHFRGETRCVRGFRLVAYDVPRGCAAAYFPEANPLVPVQSFAAGSRTPTYKAIEVSLAPAADPR